MKALTICNPYPELIARGDKPIENRRQYVSYRGALLIHAGLSRAWMDDGDDERYPDLVFGAIVAASLLTDCLRVERLPAHLRDHEHANGPWCLLLGDVRRLATPVPCRGYQGLWTPEPSVLSAIEAQLSTPNSQSSEARI